MADKQSGALSTLKVKPAYGVPVEEDDDVDQAMQRVMGAYSARQQRNYDPYLMAIGQGLLSSKGNFGEAVGMASKNYEDTRARLGQEDIDTATANLQLTQAKRDQALMRQKMAGLAAMYGPQGGGSGAIENALVDPDAFNQLVMTGVDPEVAMQMLSSSANASEKRPLITPEGIAKYIQTFGANADSDAAIKLLQAQDSAIEVKDGVMYNKRDGTAVRLMPVGLPEPGVDPKDTSTIDGTLLMDARTRLLYNNAASKGEAAADKFVKYFRKMGVPPPEAEKEYNAAPVRPEVDSGQLSVALQTLAGKTNSFKNASPEELKKIRLTPAEAKIFGALNRITAAQGNVENLSAYDKQVLSVAQGLMKKPAISLDGATETPAPKAVAPVAPASAAAPAAKAAAPAAAASAPAPALAAPAAPVVAPAPAVTAPALSAAGLPPPPTPKPYPVLPSGVLSTQQKTEYENRVKAIDKENEAALSAWKTQYGTEEADRARKLNLESDVQGAGRKKQIELAAAKEQTFLDSLAVARQMKGTSSRVLNNVILSPAGIGILSEPGFFNAVGSVIADGVSLGNTTIKLADAETALAKVMPGITGTDLQKRALVAKDLAELELLYSQIFLKGQGAITEGERRIVQKLGGSVSDNPAVLANRMQLIAQKADYEARRVEAFQEWRKNKSNDTLTINDWMSSKEAKKIDKDYDKATDALYSKFFGSPAATTSSGQTVPPQLKSAKEALLESLKRK
jgi:hypothetical protein